MVQRGAFCIALRLGVFVRLMHATEAERAAYEISPHGVHWLELDEDIPVEGPLSGVGDQTHRKTSQRVI